jgi:signal transduction histidine kinase
MASIGLLAAGVAHEVNTPLTGISSYTQMLLEHADPTDPRTMLLEKIERQTFRAAKIVNGLLTLSRPGTPGGERTLVDLNTVVTDVFALLEHQFAVGSIKVRRELAAKPVSVFAIEHQLQQVFLNLFLNAADAMPKGGELRVSLQPHGEEVEVCIADSGHGIPAGDLDRVFEPFYTTKAAGEGSGLGLSVVQGIVADHHGAIEVVRSDDSGTEFRLLLPALSGAN